MATYTAGELSSLNYVAESSYGTIPTGALSWAGDIISFKPSVDYSTEYLYATGSRTYNATARGMVRAGFNVECRARADASPYNWEDFWAVYGLGAESTTATHLGSFTASLHKLVGANYYYNVYNGCKMNKFSIQGTEVGRELVFGADVMSQYLSYSTSQNLTQVQTVTVGANAAEQAGATLRWNSICQINIAGGGLANFFPKTWKFTCDNHLDSQPGHRANGATNYDVPIAIDEGIRELTFEFSIPHGSETYTNAKILDSAITALTFKVGTKTVTLGTGSLVSNDLPELKHDLMEESVTIKFKTIAIA